MTTRTTFLASALLLLLAFEPASTTNKVWVLSKQEMEGDVQALASSDTLDCQEKPMLNNFFICAINYNVERKGIPLSLQIKPEAVCPLRSRTQQRRGDPNVWVNNRRAMKILDDEEQQEDDDIMGLMRRKRKRMGSETCIAKASRGTGCDEDAEMRVQIMSFSDIMRDEYKDSCPNMVYKNSPEAPEAFEDYEEDWADSDPYWYDSKENSEAHAGSKARKASAPMNRDREDPFGNIPDKGNAASPPLNHGSSSDQQRGPAKERILSVRRRFRSVIHTALYLGIYQ
ncbi:hypothetical protein IscW_ISCW005684 [Ixodes scapularis]|uniref:Secreted protein n=1 Tax=Ixodes scapularis TaxID=6945 RepID=B7PPB3_IXOSC|nr:hypothetical protein IscW_ISCW005684 [Ixodes scapularis]|eukprot:XP_002435605.1 hypothetical protein IscW_ISCW005684 [Ixodes scapularis]